MRRQADISDRYIKDALIALKNCAADLCAILIRDRLSGTARGLREARAILPEVFCSAIELLAHDLGAPASAGITNDLGAPALAGITNALPDLVLSLETARRILTDLAQRQLKLPLDWPGLLYEHLLQFTIDLDSSERWQLTSISKSKKRLGNFYTPLDLARFSVEKALESLIHDESTCIATPEQILSLKILDPSMGGGTFLCVAMEYLADALQTSLAAHNRKAEELAALRTAVAQNCLYGVDLDPAAVRIARLTIALACGVKANEVHCLLAAKLKCGNALVGCDRNMVNSLSGKQQFDANEFCARWFSDDHDKNRFFHWTLEFPDVLNAEHPGFDAVIGNPPWEIQKPNSREFFQQADEQYWSLGKQEALLKQQEFCSSDLDVQQEWFRYQSEYKHFSTFLQQTNRFNFQGSSDINAYKLFIELAYQLVRNGGTVSLIVPAGIYTDKGASLLRAELLEHCRWKYLYGFHNTSGIFDIHRSFKFCIVSFEKGGTTDSVQVCFDLATLEEARTATLISYAKETLLAFSPKWFALLEVCRQEDLNLVEKIAANSIRLADFVSENALTFEREFDMTNDSHLFVLRDQAESEGYQSDEYGHWLQGPWKRSSSIADRDCADRVCSIDGAFVMAMEDIRSVALPLYEGRMIGQFNVSEKGWISGKGRRAVWAPTIDQRLMPQYLVLAENYLSKSEQLKVAFLGVGSATNSRSMISACIGDFPCGNSVPVFTGADPVTALVFTACLNSFVFDYVLRLKLSGNNLNYFLLQECFLPATDNLKQAPQIARLAARLNLNHQRFAPQLAGTSLCKPDQWAHSESERLRLRAALDAIIAGLYGLDLADLEYILRDCDLPSEALSVRGEKRLNPKGFWRLDKHKPAEERHTIRTLKAFRDLEKLGLQQFLARLELNEEFLLSEP